MFFFCSACFFVLRVFFSVFLFCVFSVLLYEAFYKAKILLEIAISTKETRASE